MRERRHEEQIEGPAEIRIEGFRVETLQTPLDEVEVLSVICLTCRRGVFADDELDLNEIIVTHGPGRCDQPE